jgi:hypothetical protein
MCTSCFKNKNCILFPQNHQHDLCSSYRDCSWVASYHKSGTRSIKILNVRIRTVTGTNLLSPPQGPHTTRTCSIRVSVAEGATTSRPCLVSSRGGALLFLRQPSELLSRGIPAGLRSRPFSTLFPSFTLGLQGARWLWRRTLDGHTHTRTDARALKYAYTHALLYACRYMHTRTYQTLTDEAAQSVAERCGAHLGASCGM